METIFSLAQSSSVEYIWNYFWLNFAKVLYFSIFFCFFSIYDSFEKQESFYDVVVDDNEITFVLVHVDSGFIFFFTVVVCVYWWKSSRKINYTLHANYIVTFLSVESFFTQNFSIKFFFFVLFCFACFNKRIIINELLYCHYFEYSITIVTHNGSS